MNSSFPARQGADPAADAPPSETHRPDAPRRFWAFLRRQRELIALAAVGNVFTVFLVMLVPLFAKLVIDEAIPGRNVGLLVGLALGLFLLQAIRFVIGYCHDFLIHYAGQRTVFDIRRALFHHLQLLHLAFYEKEKTASLVNRVIHDAAAIQQFINTAFSSIANSLVTLLIALAIMFALNPAITIVCAATLPLYFFVIHRYRTRLREQHHDVKERQSRLAGRLGETFAGIRVVKSFAQEDHERRKFVLAIKDNFASELALPLIGVRMNAALGLMFFAVYCGVMVALGISAIGGKMSIGGYVAYTSYLWMLFGPLSSLSALIQSSTNARTGFERILTLLDTKPGVTEAAEPVPVERITGRIHFEHVDFAYGRRRALHDFDLEVEPGRIVALVGPSGSGKSTVVSLLTRFYDPDNGRVLVDGVDLRQIKIDAYLQQVGIVLQDNFLFSGTIEENILYGRPDATRKDLERAARLANALEFIEQMPEGFRSTVGQGGVTLSGGQRQRIAIARCILKDPRILILDEATSALDTQSEALIQESLDRLMAGRTVFIVAHRLTTIRKANQIVVMQHGRIVETGSHDQLMATGRVYPTLHRPRVVNSLDEHEAARQQHA